MKFFMIAVGIFLLSGMPASTQNIAGNCAVFPTQLREPTQQRLNLFIVSKREKGRLDLASRFNVFRSKMKSFFRRKKFIAIVASDASQMSRKVERILKKRKASIGTIWFDSHGMYKKGYSLFFIGENEYSYKTLKDSSVAAPLRKLSVYTCEDTRVVIGSCYGGATYHRLSIDYMDTTRMNGDSLMMAVGEILGQGKVYASESWVMTKPGLFLKRSAAAGHPGRKLFLDICYRPAWENIGKWNEYNVASKNFKSINPLTMDMYGNAIVRVLPYPYKLDERKSIVKNLRRLKPGLYK